MPKSCTPTAREREVYRYFQPLEASTPTIDRPRGQRKDTPKSSADPVLTAFAQLGAHRLHAKRGLITLSTRDTEFILAEATVGLHLQKDNDANEPLWHGTAALKLNSGLGMDLCRIFSNDSELEYLVVDDLRKADTFKDKCIVSGPPFLRFLACVPLRSCSTYNMVIGTYIIVDDKPRDGLSEDEKEFLIDMGVTVMDHLDAQRNNQKQSRSERMMKAVGLFIEGKSTLREWWLEGGHKTQQTQITKRMHSDTVALKGQADIEFGIQDPVEEFSKQGLRSLSDHHFTRPSLFRSNSSSTLDHMDRTGDGRPLGPIRFDTLTPSDSTAETVFSRPKLAHTGSVTTVETETSATDTRRNSNPSEMPPQNPATDVAKELQEALISKDLRAVFSRASNLIREASGVDGSIFYDASLGTFGTSSEADILAQKAPENFHINEAVFVNDDEVASKTSDTDTSTSHTNHSETHCTILGYSTRKRSSLKSHSAPMEHRKFPERVLKTLFKRYPHGKVFNFEEDGSFSSSDTDNAYLGDIGPDLPQKFVAPDISRRRKRISREAEAAALLKALPGARSIYWFPLWDSSRERWYAGSLVWSTSSTRTLCPLENLTYLAAFGNSIMAEVARISSQVLNQMKSDFISSISHELRSPLHGVLASVEFLQETAMTEMQEDMVSNINASGRVLLDTINHVLEFSKVNKRFKEKNKGSNKRNGKKKSRIVFEEHDNLDNTTDDSADICLLSEEVIESVWVGRNLTKLAYDKPILPSATRNHSVGAETPITIIMDVQARSNWTFEADPGAWRRILLNLFGNSMKYTKAGFIKVSVKIEDEITIRGKRSRSTLVLKVKDSGKGISKEFLKNHLYKPFTQEDSLAVGAGLGLSIVRHIIQDLGGEINFVSEPGVGTEATVKLPMTSSPAEASKLSDLVAEVKDLSKGKRFVLEGFDRYPDISEAPTGILSADVEAAMFLKSSMTGMLAEWFDMEPVVVSGSNTIDVVVIMESGISTLSNKLKSYESVPDPPIIIVLCSTYPAATSHDGVLKTFYVAQPYGPHKIAKTLHHAFTNATTTPPSETQNGFSVPTSPDPNLDVNTSPIFQSPMSEHHRSPLESPLITMDIDRRTSIDTSIMKPNGIRVLLVEDNEINLKLLVAYMRKLKLWHATAINGLEALNAYKEANGEFDVVFMDISMPIMSGIESTKHIRKFEKENDLDPVALVALTGAANPDTRQEAFSSGVDLFLTKPVPMKSLKVMLDDLKEKGRKGLAT